MQAAHIALVEDDPVMGQSVMDWLSVKGYRAAWYHNGRSALAALAEARPDALICDIRLPDMNGEEVYRRLAPGLGPTPAIFITGFGEVEQAVRLMRAGAADYVTKPFEIEQLLSRMAALLAPAHGSAGAPAAGEAEAKLGLAPAIVTVERMLRRVASLDSTVLIGGPSGSGKEVAAHLLHEAGSRAPRPFVALNCAAIPVDLVESEVFGHERGAFTGAHARHEGVAERAGDGTLFLDEVGELPLGMQAKLLRLIEQRVFRRVGGERDLPFRARVVAATNADLRQAVAAGQFRDDLYYRLSVIGIEMPPLAARREDIVPLARRFLGRFAAEFGRPLKGFTPLAEDELLAHDFPGHVRELKNRVERAVALAERDRVSVADLFPERGVPARSEDGVVALAASRDAAERRAIVAALEATQGDVTSAARRLDVSRSTLFEKVKRLGIRHPAS